MKKPVSVGTEGGKPEPQLAFPARKRPQQARSRQMVDRLLAAAAQVFVLEGFAAATTNRIAEVGGVSVGSLYQFFPNKHALLAELHRVWTARLGVELDAALVSPHRPLLDLIDEVLGVHARLQRESAGLLGFLLTTHFDSSAKTVRQAIQERLEHIARLRRPDLEPAQVHLMALMTIHIVDGLYTVLPGQASDPRVRQQVRQALLGYLTLALKESD
ncbi:TetR/AcrR family transcriptional regulator [Deinococcus hohokamensis]|uniref:TetR/AcrR family transcriptional regulator n=1 Tax=Deinococcus hohokamensis TaxID=309883 RepID=A0ABV9IDP0_9DEIO